MEEDTRQLRVEVRKIEQRRSEIMSCIPTKNNVWSVVSEFFHLFRNGIPQLDLLTPTVQLDFVRATMAPNVRCGQERCGAEALIDAWCRLSFWFPNVEVKLQRLDKYSDSLLVATITTSLTITERTLCNVFPHLWTNTSADKREDTLPLARRLLGERIVLQGSIAFEWDSGYGRVTSIITASDMLTPVRRLVGSLENASRVFEHSLISPDFQW
ncbi:hypothetical protein P3T76_007631 [Phytophthora citrophthora]|uniref:Bzip transcription factor n=1 Tax=Phytophthora citrophthora TaxID=4793 RepID=A0AAD9GM31_9STRA|nr:hypothetical protein P3T76_007630 [Phytophthora citrophthora]KAK1940925.1 hypothetical protein P3T76_007631 [Phytophthora citrophthora]